MQIDYTVGAELEFYICSLEGNIIADLASGKFPQKRFDILPQYKPQIESFISELKEAGFDIELESGPGQFEAQFKLHNDGQLLANEIDSFKSTATKIAAKHELSVNFQAKPFTGQCGNGLHIHYCSNLFDPYGLAANGGFMQQKLETENDYILWAIGGMLANMNQYSKIFFPNTDSAQRITPYLNAPTKICWGRNNRSCAIRIPDSRPKRIEHRVAGADAQAQAVIDIVIKDAEHGITNKISPGEPIYGNAWDSQYKCESIQ